ncbi:hypothetical protein QJS83_09205 [Bdellovibrio sp. 22V]|uniref:hypothetical protein n=1 Tax=Bdellovibrio TaxID=958 RepID=UPI002543F249|nr:hypothetical protein [Bdellovibrio sp. 22V]WII70634.1 hypothetical protein QJS83_09205 [Bdellovibrio sp. 22V]
MFKRQPTDTQLIFVTLILVLLMGIPTFQTLANNDDEVPSSEVAAQPSPARVPASIAQQQPHTVPSALSSFTQYDLSCAKKGQASLKITGSYVQFQGKNCLKNYKTGDIEIINKSNGYTASVFSRGSDKYQTDLIQLQNGENEIAIRYRERSGKAVEEVVRVRSSQI